MTFSDLDDAFRELERRADTADHLVAVPGAGDRDRRHPSGRARIAAVSAAVVVVAAVAVGVGYTATGRSHPVAGAGNSPTHASAPPVRTSTAAATTADRPAVSATDVPRTRAALVARFRSILGDTATFTVDTANSTDHLITGVLTSTAGTRGLYVLELDKDVALCGAMAKVGQRPTPLPCPNVKSLADGSALKVDPDFADGPPDGVMNDAILNRPDGWQISLYTANVQGKFYGAPVLGRKPALTTAQVTDVVTSPAWLKK